MSTLFIEKYKPKSLSEYLDQKEATEKFYTWLKKFIKGETSKPALLFGPSGSGKTLLVELEAKELGFELVKIDPVSISSFEELCRALSSTLTSTSLFGSQGKIILIDEVEGLRSLFPRFISFLIHVIEKSKYPIVLIANNAYALGLRDIRLKSETIKFRRIPKPTILHYLKRVVQLEGGHVDNKILNAIAENAKGDVRAALNDLQSILLYKTQIHARDIKIDVFAAINKLLRAKSFEEGLRVFEELEIDYPLLFQWVAENLPLIYNEPRGLVMAYEKLSKADIFLGRIKKEGNWSLLKYFFDLMFGTVAFVSVGKRKKFIPFKFPTYLKKISSSRKDRGEEKELVAKISSKCHVSSKKVISEYLPFIKLLVQKQSKYRKEVINYLSLGRDEVKKLIHLS